MRTREQILGTIDDINSNCIKQIFAVSSLNNHVVFDRRGRTFF